MLLPRILYVLHVLGAAAWVGGMIFAVTAMHRALGALEPPQRIAAQRVGLGRFLRLIWHVMPVILLTGWTLLFGWYGGFAGAGWHIHVMHLTGLIMAAVFLVIFFGPWAAFRARAAAGDIPGAARAGAQVRQLVLTNLALGLLTVAVAAWGRFGG